MPVHLHVLGRRPRRVPVVKDPFRIGRGPEADLVLDDERAGAIQAEIRMQRGEYLLAGASGEPVFVNGKRVPVMALRSGDEIRVLDPSLGEATLLRFENLLGEAFVPPGASLAAAWMAHQAFRRAGHGLDLYGGLGTAVGGRPREALRVVREEGSARRLLVKVLGPVRSPEEGDHHLALVAALAGADHPAVVPVVDGGLAPGNGTPVRWLVTDWVEGDVLRERLADGGPLPPALALRVLLALAGGLVHLHARGVVHRDVAPANVVLTPPGRAVLIDPGHAQMKNAPRPAGPGVLGTPGFLAPEAVIASAGPLTPAADVYGLGAVGYALFTGRPPAAGGDVLEVLAQSTALPTRPRDLGVELPPPLESALLDALAPEPRSRPSARQLERRLAFAAATLGLGDPP